MMYGRFITGFRGFIKQSLSEETARTILTTRLANREKNFLELMRATVFGYAASPYLPLLEDAGCTFGDLESLVNRDGLDAALKKLETSGVRVSFAEFKGRAPLVRAGKTIEIDDYSFDNPLNFQSVTTQTTGSTGKPTRANLELGQIAALAPARMLSQVANGVFGQPTILYRAGLPSAAAVSNVLTGIIVGNPVRRWFSPVSQKDINAPLRFRIAGAMLPILTRASGKRYPAMEVVPTRDALIVARAARKLVDDEGRCLVRCAVSTSLAVAIAAIENGVDLTGVTFMGAAEPPSDAKVKGIRQSGARYVTNYAMNEAGMIGAGCAHGLDQTDVHFMRDSLAVVAASRHIEGADAAATGFAFTSLLATAPKILINVDSDDHGILEERRCGCLFDELGFTQHIRQIRSTAKLTGRGVTLVATDIVRVIEEVLPSRFGGTPQDYQLVEEEDANGRTMLTLLVSPTINISDERAPAVALYDALQAGRPGASFSGAILKGGEAVRVRREKPVPNARGKQPAFRIAKAS